LYGGFDEIHQGFVEGRDPSFFDWLFDSFGVFFGLWSVYLWKKKKS
jgi:VanZ family protein